MTDLDFPVLFVPDGRSLESDLYLMGEYTDSWQAAFPVPVDTRSRWVGLVRCLTRDETGQDRWATSRLDRSIVGGDIITVSNVRTPRLGREAALDRIAAALDVAPGVLDMTPGLNHWAIHLEPEEGS